jgi:hypothetical protein
VGDNRVWFCIMWCGALLLSTWMLLLLSTRLNLGVCVMIKFVRQWLWCGLHWASTAVLLVNLAAADC